MLAKATYPSTCIIYELLSMPSYVAYVYFIIVVANLSSGPSPSFMHTPLRMLCLFQLICYALSQCKCKNLETYPRYAVPRHVLRIPDISPFSFSSKLLLLGFTICWRFELKYLEVAIAAQISLASPVRFQQSFRVGRFE